MSLSDKTGVVRPEKKMAHTISMFLLAFVK